MKHRWLKLAARIDAMALRERLLAFLAAAAVLGYGLWMLLLAPLDARQDRLHAELATQQDDLQAIENDVKAKLAARQADPNAAALTRLAALRIERDRLRGGLQSLRTGLVGSDQMVPMLQRLVAANRNLKLVSLKSLPVSGLGEAARPAAAVPGQPPAAAAADAPREVLYRHGVELVLQGSYLHMIDYMQALQALPTQLLWGSVELDAQAYPKAQLTLTLYTLSLDDRWMTL
ncbi:MAG TPA: type II secretion system protein GspM [Pseudoduganella sp.]|jgi:MSHA biogenesis protein MshJ